MRLWSLSGGIGSLGVDFDISEPGPASCPVSTSCHGYEEPSCPLPPPQVAPPTTRPPKAADYTPSRWKPKGTLPSLGSGHGLGHSNKKITHRVTRSGHTSRTVAPDTQETRLHTLPNSKIKTPPRHFKEAEAPVPIPTQLAESRASPSHRDGLMPHPHPV